MYRSGIGYDVHRLVPGRPLWLGGVNIPFAAGLEGHSDADVLLHAVCDALLGAAALGDIGEHFPNTDDQWRDISSLTLLAHTQQLIMQSGYGVINIDAVVIAEAPALKPFKTEMSERIADTLGIERGAVSIKATTNEGLGFVGRQEGIAAYATVLLQRSG